MRLPRDVGLRWKSTFPILLWMSVLSCSSSREMTSSGKVPGKWDLGQIRSAIVDVLSYYGHVKVTSRNRFQSARIPTNDFSNLGQEYSQITAQIEATHPHEILVTSAVYRIEKNKLTLKGKNEKLEKVFLSEVKRRLVDSKPVIDVIQ